MKKLRTLLRKWLGVCVESAPPDKEMLLDLEMTRRDLDITRRNLLSVRERLAVVQGLLSKEQTAHAATNLQAGLQQALAQQNAQLGQRGYGLLGQLVGPFGVLR